MKGALINLKHPRRNYNTKVSVKKNFFFGRGALQDV